MISVRGKLTGVLNSSGKNIYPELEDLKVTPTNEVQEFKSNKYGYDNVTVDKINAVTLYVKSGKEQKVYNGKIYDEVVALPIECEELNITPTIEVQTFEGMYDKVTVEAASGGSGDSAKKFSSVDEMNASTDNNEGDLAIVYSVTNEGAVMEQDTLFNYLYFPSKLVLSKQYFNVVNNTLIPIHQQGSGMVKADKSYISGVDYINFIQFGFGSNDGLAYTGAIQYGSNDGIVFNRLDTAGPRGAFDLIVDWKFKDGAVWDDILQEIMLLEIHNVGVYEYKNGSWKLIG